MPRYRGVTSDHVAPASVERSSSDHSSQHAPAVARHKTPSFIARNRSAAPAAASTVGVGVGVGVALGVVTPIVGVMRGASVGGGVCVRVIASQLSPPTAMISTATIATDTQVGTLPRERRLGVLER